MSDKTGVFFPILVKSSRLKLMFADFAIANRWRTALVEPPKAMTTLIEFSNELFVKISLGLISFSNKLSIAWPTAKQSFFFSSETASCELLPGKLIPKASIADAIVFAVYIPPHEPGPGSAFFSTAISSSSLI